MAKSLISVTEQLAIIRLAKQYLIKDVERDHYTGLCWYLECAIQKIHGNQFYDDFTYIQNFIPIFTRVNAILHGNAYALWESTSFWWPKTKEGSVTRIAFLDWMEEDLLK